MKGLSNLGPCKALCLNYVSDESFTKLLYNVIFRNTQRYGKHVGPTQPVDGTGSTTQENTGLG